MPSQIKIINTHLSGKEKSLFSIFSSKKLKSLKIAEVYNISKNLKNNQFKKTKELLYNPISQKYLDNENIHQSLRQFGKFNFVIEIRYLPGVTDNIGNTAQEIIRENLKDNKLSISIGSSLLFFIESKNKKIIQEIIDEESNPLIHFTKITSYSKYIQLEKQFKNIL